MDTNADRIANDRLMTRKELAAYLGIEPGTIARWKWAGTDSPPCLKIGRSVRYWKSDVDRWLWQRATGGRAAVVAESRTGR